MKAILACVSAALLCGSAAAAEPWKVYPSAAERYAGRTSCRVSASRGKQGWYGHIYATTSRYNLVMDITDGSDGRDIVNNVNVFSIDRQYSREHNPLGLRFQMLNPFDYRPVRLILDEACPLNGLSGPSAEVMKIALSHDY